MHIAAAADRLGRARTAGGSAEERLFHMCRPEERERRTCAEPGRAPAGPRLRAHALGVCTTPGPRTGQPAKSALLRVCPAPAQIDAPSGPATVACEGVRQPSAEAIQQGRLAAVARVGARAWGRRRAGPAQYTSTWYLPSFLSCFRKSLTSIPSFSQQGPKASSRPVAMPFRPHM